MGKGLLIILSGPSGVGKGTMRKALMNDPRFSLSYSVSLTTRLPRPGEEEGKDYYFVSEEEFQRNIDEGNLLEHAKFVGHRYGTPKDKVEEKRNKGENVLLEIEVEGTKQVLEKLKDDKGLLTIFLIPPSLEQLEARIRGRRTEEESVVQERLNKAKREMKLKSNYQYVVTNDTIDGTEEEIAQIILNKLKEYN